MYCHLVSVHKDVHIEDDDLEVSTDPLLSSTSRVTLLKITLASHGMII